MAKKKDRRRLTFAAKGKRLHKPAIIKAIRNSYGNITIIAERLGCERMTIYNWLQKDEEIAQMIKDEREKIVDLAESKLVSKVEEGSETMIALVLKTLGRERGYVEKQNIVNENVNYNIDLSKLTDEQLQELKRKIAKRELITDYLRQLGLIQ